MPTREASHAEIERITPLRTQMLFNLSIGAEADVLGNVFWEELTCIGYNPQSGKLEAVVAIKRSSGYSGGLCTAGSNEFVRFFVDWGAGFVDVGVVSFRAHDIPDAPVSHHPLEYSVEIDLPVGEHRRRCTAPVLPRVRGVLSWNVPPSLDPNAIGIFGNRLDVHIQIAPLPSISVVGELAALELAPSLSLAALAKAYKGASVPAHRFLTPALAPLLHGGPPTAHPLGAEATQLKELGINLPGLAGVLEQVSADTSFEQLTCVGLATAFDTLAAAIHIKRPAGYSGDLCHAGSVEYVAFWADWNDDGTFDEYLGTAQVGVHDIGGALPADGLSYAVTLFSPRFARHLHACTTPMIVRIRAVLSWAVPPSTSDPNALNTWGNRLDAKVQLRPGRASDELIDAIYRVGGVALPDISTTSFLAYPSTVLTGACGQTLMDRPFGDLVTISGRLYNTGPAGSVRYRVRYKSHTLPDVDANWTPVATSQSYTLIIPPSTFIPVSQGAGTEPGLGGGWFDYIEDPTTSPPIFEIDARLADWFTVTLEGVFDLRLEYRRVIDPPGVFLRSSVVTITLHNHNMTSDVLFGVALNPALDLDIVILGGDCHSYNEGATINGQLRVVDPYFGAWNLDVQPASHVHGAAVSPPCRSYTSTADGGDAAAAYTINTSVLDKCGYALILHGTDRTIRSNNGAVTHTAAKAVGFSVV